ncbi:hypothetical protein [Paramaledivibacter caminithermalis]|uniref:Zinc-finger n=1 Tax=Paramaledivibacter caminithermalis (strain DSM 15212 / CIP 107654 / DViRD3) TaxID=1121301 RepID=A0A1M6K2F0_PARC5|nr:hypothetical protein [Paramaledivibacter caminithermalis]SHJ53032.1 hypothetical protein SAMN02745912_00223 [Paramaledivibacter caminithermalis DSM 15212]
MNRKKCFVIKDLIKFYGKDGLEGETKKWVDDHLLTCSDCKSWMDTYKEDNEDFENISLTDKEKALIKRVKLVFKLGIGVIIFLAAWVSIWLFV